VGIVH